jgi:hypothetical protein
MMSTTGMSTPGASRHPRQRGIRYAWLVNETGIYPPLAGVA